MKKTWTTLIYIGLSFISSPIYAQQLPLCRQHEVQANLPYSEERIQRMKAFDEEQKQIQEQLKNQPQKRQVYRIPVVFHILHYGGEENITNEQIYDAMAVLNRDFRKLNADTATVDYAFNASNPNATATPADIEIEFVLATKAPDGTCFNGITRTESPTTFSTADGFVQLDAVKAGNDVYRGMWPAKNYMNIIVAKNIGSAAGYTFLPASFNSDNMYGSIWVNYTYVGRIGTGSETKSRTLTHEVGHWLNLYHTWGPTNNAGLASNCDEDDEVLDTPNTIGVTSCKLSENTCGVKANVENYMDYSYCSKMFTPGQRDRMRASLLTLQRKNIWTPSNQVFTGIDGSQGLCSVDFRVDKAFYCVGEQVTLKDYSSQGQTTWAWEMEGATPATSTQQNPTVTYNAPGVYKVKLTVGDGSTSLTKTKEAFIHVNSIAELPYFEGFEYTQTGSSLVDKAVIRNLTPNRPTFEVTTDAAATDSKSACYHNFYASETAINEFISPMFDLSGLTNTDKITLSFKYAYKKKTASDNEKLTISASKDCGTIWQTRKDLVGSSLSTEIDSTNYVANQADFKTVHVTNLSNAFFTSNFQFKLAFQSSNGNNLYLDDINLYKGTPSDVNIVGVKELSNLSGWNLFPNPAANEISINYVLNQFESTPLTITDITGKIVFTNVYQSAQGMNEIYLDISDFSKGVYFVQLGKTTKKFIKN